MKTEVQKKIPLLNRYGLHVRPSTSFVETAGRFKSKITVQVNGVVADGKSVIEMLSLAAQCGDIMEIHIEGEDAEAAMTAIEKLIADRFGFSE